MPRLVSVPLPGKQQAQKELPCEPLRNLMDFEPADDHTAESRCNTAQSNVFRELEMLEPISSLQSQLLATAAAPGENHILLHAVIDRGACMSTICSGLNCSWGHSSSSLLRPTDKPCIRCTR